MRPLTSTPRQSAAAPRVLALFGARVLFGQERANIEALAALQTEGCEVLCVIRPETWPELMALRAALDARGLAWRPAPYIDYPLRGWILHTTLHNPPAYLRGGAALRRIAREFAPTHLHAFNALYVAAFYGALHALDQPMIFRVGEKPVLHNVFYRAMWRFIRRRATHFVAASHYIRGELEAIGIASDRITVIYEPPPARKAAPPFVLPEGFAGSSLIRFVYVGQLIPGKGVGLLVDAFEQVARSHPQARLLIAGRVSEWSGDSWVRNLRERAAASDLMAGRVRFLGLVENAPDLIRQCDVHIAPSIEPEGYGLVVIEAKSAGRPSIIFPSGGMAELVQDGVDGAVVSDKSSFGLAAAMTLYAERPGLADDQGRRALASLDGLDLNPFSTNWRRIYEDAADRERDGSRAGASGL